MIEQTFEFDNESLVQWFGDEQRDLPWRRSLDPYAVWVSEVMLQQTQVSVVIPYFERWMAQFPTIQSLATAPLDAVLKAWEGLGYYSRARHLHAGAQMVLENYGGRVPDDPKELAKIKGLGPYTIGAIRSFAFHHKAAAVDGNVIRVIARYFAIEEDMGRPSSVQKIHKAVNALLPDHEPWVVSEALIELGAVVCAKKPKCSVCPLKKTCSGYRLGIGASLPKKLKKVKYESLSRSVAVVSCQGALLVRRCAAGEVMRDLYEFPYCDNEQDVKKEPIDALKKFLLETHLLDVTYKETLPEVSHSFTRFRVKLLPFLFKSRKLTSTAIWQWVPVEELAKLPFSSGHRRIFDHFSHRA